MTSDNDLRRASHINAERLVTSEARAALRERVARAICREKCAFMGEPPCFVVLDDSPFSFPPETCCEPGCVAEADAAIAVVLERAAKVAEPSPTRCDCISKTETGGWICECDCSNSGDYADAMAWCRSANNAAAIRALIPASGDATS